VVPIYFIPKVQNMLAAIVPFHIFTTLQWYRQSCLSRCIYVCLVFILPDFVYGSVQLKEWTNLVTYALLGLLWTNFDLLLK
jgi:hypothetical protein